MSMTEIMKATFLLLTVTAFAADPSLMESRKTDIRNLLDHSDFAAAAEKSKQLNREAPDNVLSYQLMAASELGLGNYEQAERDIQWMLDLRIGKADAFGWLLIARLREETGDLDGAVDAVNLAYARVVPGQLPDTASLLTYSAHLQIAAGKFDYAEKILQDNHAGEAAASVFAKLRVAQHRRAEAIEILKGIAKPGAHPSVLYQLAEATGQRADYANFERAALERAADSDSANRQLVLYYAGPGKRTAEALKIARREAAQRHDNLTLDALAVALFAAGNTAEARTTMARVLAAGSRDPEVMKHATQMGVHSK